MSLKEKVWGLLEDGEEFVDLNGHPGVYRNGRYAMDTGGRYVGVYEESGGMRHWTGTGYEGKRQGDWVVDWGNGAGYLRRTGNDVLDGSGRLIGFIKKKI